MNLSDLVHRTAGDGNNKNRLLAPNNTSNSSQISTSNSSGLSVNNGYSNPRLFHQHMLDHTVGPTNVFTDFGRQDQQFLFSVPNTDWVNNSLFFNNNGLTNGQSSLIEPLNQATPTSDINNNPYLKQNFLHTSITHDATATITNSNIYTLQQQQQQQQQQTPSQQQSEGHSLIAPFQHAVFHNFNLTTPSSPPSLPPLPPSPSPPPQILTSKFHKNDHVQFKANPFIAKKKPAPETNIVVDLKTKAAHSVTGSPEAQASATSGNKPTTTDGLQLLNSALEQTPKPKVKITGDNVASENIEEGYIQFVLENDASYISDGIDSLVYTKRKFQSVPKTGDISYTTWDIYQLVKKLHKQEIKNWSQLVGQLGLHDMAGRPQFAQRVKRWMNRYKIDCYFDYLLGNAYEFNAPEGKYSTCLMIGNYKKRKLDHNNSNIQTATTYESEDEELEEDQADQEYRIPVLLAGSRKRMRDNSQNSLQMIETAQKFLRLHQSEESDPDNDDDDDDNDDNDQNEFNSNNNNSSNNDASDDEKEIEEKGGSDVEENSFNIRSNVNIKEEDTEMTNDDDDDDDGSEDDDDKENMEEEEEEEELADDEEDELASSTSSPISPAKIIIPAPVVNPSPPKPMNTVPSSPVKSKMASPITTKSNIASPSINSASPALSAITKSSVAPSPSITNKSALASPSFMNKQIFATSPANSAFSVSSSSSPGTVKLPLSPPPAAPPAASSHPSFRQQQPLSLLSIPPLSSCSNCMTNDAKVASMESELSDLRAHVSQLEARLEKQNSQVNKLIRLRDRTERWRKQIISDLARGPQMASDNDDDEDEDDDDEDEDDEVDDDESTDNNRL